MTLRQALAQSINIPSIKLLYLAGIDDSLKIAQAMGIKSLKDKNQYGLTLVLGGGEVSLLDLTSAYGVFANNGARNPYEKILKVEDSSGRVFGELEAAGGASSAERNRPGNKRHPLGQHRPGPGFRLYFGALFSETRGGGQNRNHKRLSRRLDRRIYSFNRRWGLGGE